MASIRRNDTLHRRHKYSRYKCRPVKLDTENSNVNFKKFKIVRRIFLASSFDRWRKLRSSLNLKDSSLAWHLMEAHENGECTSCRASEGEEDENSQKLQASLVSCVRNFFEFEDYIDMIGNLCLDFGKGRKLKIKLKTLIQSNGQFELQNQSEINDHSFSPTEDEPRSLPKMLSSQYAAGSSSLSVDTSNDDLPVASALKKTTAESFCGEMPAVNTIVSEDSQILVGNECKSFNLSSCSMESGVSVEIDVVGTDSSHEIVHEDHQSNLCKVEDTFSPPNHGRENNAHKPLSEVEGSEDATNQVPNDLSNHSPIEILSCESSQLNGVNYPTEVSSHQNSSPKPCCGEELHQSMETLSVSKPLVPLAHSDGEFPIPAQTNSSNEELREITDLPAFPSAHTIDRPLDMSVFKLDGDRQAPSSKNSVLGNAMFSSSSEGDHRTVSPHTLTAGGKRKAPSESNDASNRTKKDDSSPIPKKLQRNFGKPAGHLSTSEWKNEDSIKELCRDSDNNNEKYLEKKICYETKSSLDQHPCPSSDVSYSIQQDSSVEPLRKIQLKEDEQGPDRNSSSIFLNTSLTSSTPPPSSDITVQQYPKSPNKMTTSRHNTIIANNSTLSTHHPNHSVTNSPAGCTNNSSSIPWQRRDMSRKEEYEFLEMNPFCDLAEFSARHPHVHQRTYYRWKRRIKEEFMVLEQCSDMSFSQFSSVVLQAKENVFTLWKSLIAQGKGFFAPSDTSKRLEAKLTSAQVPSSPQEQQQQQQHSAEYLYLQKNLSATFLDFSQQFPRASLNVFNSLKQKSLQEFSLFHQNRHMSYKDFSNLIYISEEVFKEWQTQVQSLTHFQGAATTHFPRSLQSLQSVGAHAKAPDTNGFHSKNHQMNMANVMKHHLASSESSVLSGLNESMTQNLSASYLASLQNLMFPWPSYYGLSPPLAPQHLLPFMLWPGMSGVMGGLAGGPAAGPLALLSQLQAASSTSSPSSLASGSHSSPKLGDLKVDSAHTSASVAQDMVPAVKDERDYETDQTNNTLKMSDPERNLSPYPRQQQSDREELGDLNTPGAVSRSRKQNLQEYIHYLHRPGLGFRDLVTLFPSISSRTFYRWRKEMNAAVLLVGENPDMEFLHFQAVFPDIPEQIFHLWQGRAKRGESLLQPEASLSHCQDSLSKPEFTASPQLFHTQKPPVSPSVHVESKSAVLKQDRATSISEMRHSQLDRPLSLCHPKSSPVSTSSLDDSYSQAHFGEELAVQKKCYKEDYLFVQRNPSLDFASFSRQFPNTSVRTFYRWKKELRDAVDFLRCNPAVDYTAYKAMDATVSEEVFNIWRAIVQNNVVFEEETNPEVIPPEGVVHTPTTDENYNTALSYLHLNPSISYSQFIQLFPEVREKTFELWKKETHQLINYIHTNPSVQFSDISALLPHISHSSFLKWKEMPISDISSERPKTDANLNDNSYSVEYTKSEMTKAFVYLMYNPTMSFKSYKAKFEFVSPSTFELWLTKIRAVVVDILSHPSMEYKDFNIKDMSRDLFDKLRSLQPQDLAIIEERCQEARLDDTMVTHCPLPDPNSAQMLQTAFEFMQMHPSISWDDFHTMHPIVPQEVYQNWVACVSDQIAFLKDKPDLTYADFLKLYPHTSQEAFAFLKRDTCSPSLQNHTHHFLGTSQQIEDKELPQSEHRKNARISPSDETLCTQHHMGQESTSRREENFLLMESSLSKLAKFAHSSELLSPHCARDSSKQVESAAPLQKTPEGTTDLRQSCDQSAFECEQVSNYHRSSGSPYLSTSLAQQNKMHDFGTERSSSSSSSLSALESLACEASMHHKGHRQATQNPSPIPSKELVPLKSASASSSTPNPWQNHLHQVNAEEATGNRDDDEAFSSQRQKKMSRAEYMFVKANPEVDSQEFARIFPGVSARTFYRWKKEIRAQLQPS